MLAFKIINSILVCLGRHIVFNGTKERGVVNLSELVQTAVDVVNIIEGRSHQVLRRLRLRDVLAAPQKLVAAVILNRVPPTVYLSLVFHALAVLRTRVQMRAVALRVQVRKHVLSIVPQWLQLFVAIFNLATLLTLFGSSSLVHR